MESPSVAGYAMTTWLPMLRDDPLLLRELSEVGHQLPDLLIGQVPGRRHGGARRPIANDPEELPIEEQIKIFRGGRRFAGVTGSSMHNLLFAEPSTIATYINRFSYVRPTYRMIDELKNIEAHYIAGCDTTIQPAATESPDPVRLNMDAIVKGLQDCGAITKTQISYNNSAAFYDNLYIAAAYLRRAQKLGWSGKHKEAMDECDTGLARVKNDPKLLLEKARNIKYLGDPKAAFSICMELLRRHPLDENILRTTAEWGRGLIEKAQHDDLIQRLSVIHPKSDYSTLLVARWHFDSGRLDTCLNELHSLKKMDDRAYTIQIRCLIGLSRLEEALEKINEARRNLKDIDISILRLAVTVCEKLEDIDSAYIYAKSCLKEDPDNPEMVQHVKRFMEQLAAPHTDDMRVTTTSNVA